MDWLHYKYVNAKTCGYDTMWHTSHTDTHTHTLSPERNGKQNRKFRHWNNNLQWTLSTHFWRNCCKHELVNVEYYVALGLSPHHTISRFHRNWCVYAKAREGEAKHIFRRLGNCDEVEIFVSSIYFRLANVRRTERVDGGGGKGE